LEHEEALRKYTEGKLLEAQQKIVDLAARGGEVMGAIKSPVCSNGHPMVPENLYYRSNGQRECKACKAQRNQAAEEKRKAALAKKPKKLSQRTDWRKKVLHKKITSPKALKEGKGFVMGTDL
jgi:hypothetical protein